MNSVNPAGGPAQANDHTDALTALGDALDRLGGGSVRDLVQLAFLLRAHPQWAIWLPKGGREWTAVRPAGSGAPGPEMPMLWVRAETVGELAQTMRRADAGLAPGAMDEWPVL